MLLQITHTTDYRYDDPVHYALQRLRLTPQTGPGQVVKDWNIKVDGAAIEAGFADQFGNMTHLVSTQGPSSHIRIIASGTVDTEDRAGVFGQHQGYVPLWLYLRETPPTRPGKLTREIVRSLSGDNELAKMHDLMGRLHSQIAYETGTTGVNSTAEQALEQGQGVCQDHAHAMLAAARLMSLPARYVSGYLMIDDRTEQTASHAWAEVFLAGLGWVGFDAANNLCPDARYVRIATGLCYADAAPVSGMRTGAAAEDLDVRLVVEQKGQSQSQSQS